MEKIDKWAYDLLLSIKMCLKLIALIEFELLVFIFRNKEHFVFSVIQLHEVLFVNILLLLNSIEFSFPFAVSCILSQPV